MRQDNPLQSYPGRLLFLTSFCLPSALKHQLMTVWQRKPVSTIPGKFLSFHRHFRSRQAHSHLAGLVLPVRVQIQFQGKTPIGACF